MEPTAADRRARLDDRIDAVIDGADGDAVAVAREAVRQPDDRWYGRLVAVTHGAMGGETDPAAVVHAGTAIELLRGYCRLRSDLLAGGGETRSDSPSRDQMASLLAGDYLYTSAFSALGSVDHVALADCFRALTSALEAITEAFSAAYAQAPAGSDWSLPERSAGSLGACAAAIGATLSGVEGGRRDEAAAFGRALAAARAIEALLDSDAGCPPAVRSDFEGPRLRERAQMRRAEVEAALQELVATADVATLRAFRSESLR